MGWEDLSTHWYKNYKAFTPEELTSHLKIIVSKQCSRSVPTKTPVLIPVQKALLQIVKKAPDVVSMDAARIETSDEFEQQARRTRLEREAVDIVGRYSNM